MMWRVWIKSPKVVAIIMMLAAVALIVWSILFLKSNIYDATPTQASVTPSPSLTSTNTPHTKTNTHSNSNEINPTIIVALIGLAGVIIGGCIAGGFAIYQTRRSGKLEKELQKRQHQHEQEIILLQKTIDEQYKIKDDEQRRKETDAETARAAMVHAQTLNERINAYRSALRSDPNISSLKILDMPSPLKVTSVYVRLRLHREARASFELHPVLDEAESQHDPNAILIASQIHLENRFNTALEPEEAIRTYKHCVIVGDPGAGKTTLLKHLALKSIDKQLNGLPDLAIHIELNAFASSKYNNLVEFATARWYEKYGFPKSEARSVIIKHLKAGTALLLLDALDETVIGDSAIKAENSYQRVTNAIMQIATRYHLTPIVVTARKAGYQQRTTLMGFTELEVLDFRPQDIEQFVINWFASYSDLLRRTNAAELNAKLGRNPRIQALAANPLLLSLIVILYEAQLDLPDRRAELYKQCIETLLTKWDASRNIRRRREFKPEHKLLLLDEIAWHFHNQGKRYFPEKELLKVIADFLPAIGLPAEQSQRVLEEIANENGLIKEQARGLHGFLHLTLQEYFVAQRVADRNQLGLLLSHWDQPWWEEVILLFAGHTPDASLLLKMLIGQDNNKILQRDIFYTNLILAGRCLAARPIVQETFLREKVSNLLFRTLIDSPYSLTREQIADTLVEIGGAKINTYLFNLLSNKQINPLILISIASAFGKVGDRSVALNLLNLLEDSEIKLNVRQAIAYALGKLGERSIITTMVQMLSNIHIHPSIRVSIAYALGDLGDLSVISELLRLLYNPQIPASVREEIASALGKLGDKSVEPYLLQLAIDWQLDTNIRCKIIDALGILNAHTATNVLLQMLEDQKNPSNLRQCIAITLSKLGDRSIIPAMMKLLSNPSTNPNVGQTIANAFEILESNTEVSKLLQIISNSRIDLAVRQRIINTLAIKGERTTAPELLRLISNPQVSPILRIDLIDALGLIGNRSVVPQLSRMRDNSQLDGKTRVHLLNTLSRLGKQSVIPELVELLSTTSIDVNLLIYVVNTLGQLGEKSIVPYLLGSLSNRQLDKSIRIKFAYVIGKLADDETTIRILVTYLTSIDIADTIYRTLWTVSRRVGKRINIQI